jgi:cell division protease FtsH
MIITDEDKRITAYHEGGHALVGFALPNADPVHKATIIPRGRSLGHTLSLPTEERLYMRRSEMVDKLAMMLGGRTAEEIVFIDPTAGATSDIKQATELARRMVMEWGMSDRLGPMKYGEPQGEVFLGRDYAHQRDFSDEVASIIDEEIRLLITRAHDEARAILSKHREALDRLAAALIERETLDESEIRAVLHDVAKWQHVPNGTMRIQEPEANGSQAQGIAASLSEEHHDR